MRLEVQRINREAKLPSYSHKGDAGLDLFCTEDCMLKKGEVRALPTGIKVAIPQGHVGLVWDKSGISLKGVHRLAGVIDSGYRGEVKVVMINLGETSYEVKKGMKIAQLIIQPLTLVEVVEKDKLEESLRGQGGFGSTGKY
ncbi:dUTP diphosphatase [bacterium]|nr:dUTP diphosphatase [bacterium]